MSKESKKEDQNVDQPDVGKDQGQEDKVNMDQSEVQNAKEKKYDSVKATFLFGDLKKFDEMKTIKATVPGVGVQHVPVQKVITSVAQNVYNLMNALGQKQLIVNMNDVSSSLVLEKRLDIRVGPLSDGSVSNDNQDEPEEGQGESKEE